MSDVAFDHRTPPGHDRARPFQPGGATFPAPDGPAAQLNHTPRVTALTQLKDSLNRRPSVVAQTGLSQTLSHRDAAQLRPRQRPDASAAPIQRVWKNIPGNYYEWEPTTDGLRWYQHKKTEKMYYVIEDLEQLPVDDREYYQKMEGALLSGENWLNRTQYFTERQVSEEDLEIVGEVPDEQEEQQGFHRLRPAGRWKQTGKRYSKEGQIEQLVKELYLTGDNKNIDVYGIIPKLKNLRKLGPKWEELAADPSIMLRPGMFDQFMTLMKQEKTDDPWEGRTKFAQTLGASTVYRAIYVTPDIAAGLANLDLTQRDVLLPGYCATKKEACDCNAVLMNIEAQLHSHVTGHGLGIAQSITKDPKIAEAVANHVRLKELGGNIPFSEAKSVYLLTLKIPNIDLFFVGELTKDFDNFVIDLGRADVHYPVPYTKDNEQMVIGPVLGANILSVDKIENPQGKAQPRQK